MPNLQDVVDNPELLQESIRTMMSLRGSRGEVCLNHGIRTTAELDALVRRSLEHNASDDVDVAAFRRLLGIEQE
ncbi:hypothetical protein M5E06_10040 [Azospirillum sp. A1-3]|uniref:hypothetical protein n=1 Tax=Azospirillum sp. A1-3 TaxID=185874 RepID=UPI00207744CB|nr:hypothetical protein [Azospirillum sp. A1-3]MCM8734533.1 hypothetical protein [Azospirillum sp. A1-3]